MPTSKSKQVFYSVIINGDIHNVTGRKRTPKGYVALCIRTHPNSDALKGYIFEHRVMMELLLNRYLEPHEVVHRKNEIKHDNRLENLELMEHSEHTVLHHTGSTRSTETKLKLSEAAKNRTAPSNYKVMDKEVLMKTLSDHTLKKTADLLGVSRKTIYNKLKEFKLQEWYKNVK
jgi:hypothetical protein